MPVSTRTTRCSPTGVLRLAVLASILQCSVAAAESEGFRLRLKYHAGQELTYNVVSRLKQIMSAAGQDQDYDMTYTGTVLNITAKVDPATRIALNAQINAGQWEANSKQPVPVGQSAQTWINVARTDRHGKPVARELKYEGQVKALVGQFLSQMSQDSEVHAPFPEKEVRIGSKWEGTVALPAPGLAATGKASSTIAGLETRDGRPHCTIKSKLSSDGSEGTAAWMQNMKLNGTSEVLFDIERGLPVYEKAEISVEYGGAGFDARMSYSSEFRLVSSRTLPESEVTEWTTRTLAFDDAISKVYANEADAGAKLLKAQLRTEGHAEWKQGIESALKVVEQIQKFASSMANAFEGFAEETEVDPDRKLLNRAQEEANAGKWRSAAQKYEAFATEHPEHESAAEALDVAARIQETRLGDKRAAARLRKRLVELREKQAADMAEDPQALYKCASSYAKSGQTAKALTAYRRFLAMESNSISAGRKVLARYRVARILQQLGRKKEAVSEYRAIEKIPSDDEYSANIKKRAAELAAELSGAAGEQEP